MYRRAVKEVLHLGGGTRLNSGSPPEQPSEGNRPSADKRGRYLVRPEWIRAEAVVNAGLIVVGIYIVQSLLASSFADTAARIAIVGWAVAIPPLAAVGMLNVAQESHRYASYPPYLLIARGVAQGSAAAGVVSAFWRVWMPAGIVLIVSGVAALGLYVTYLRRLEKEDHLTQSEVDLDLEGWPSSGVVICRRERPHAVAPAYLHRSQREATRLRAALRSILERPGTRQGALGR